MTGYVCAECYAPYDASLYWLRRNERMGAVVCVYHNHPWVPSGLGPGDGHHDYSTQDWLPAIPAYNTGATALCESALADGDASTGSRWRWSLMVALPPMAERTDFHREIVAWYRTKDADGPMFLMPPNIHLGTFRTKAACWETARRIVDRMGVLRLDAHSSTEWVRGKRYKWYAGDDAPIKDAPMAMECSEVVGDAHGNTWTNEWTEVDGQRQ